MGAEVIIRGRHNGKLHGEHIATHPGCRNDLVAHNFNVLDLLVVHQVCRTMHFDDDFVFMDLVVAMLEVKGDGILRTVLDEYFAEWTFDEIINT